MLTAGSDGVDGGLPGLWLTVTDLARRMGISKQAASKRVDRLETGGHVKTRPGPRGTKLVNLAEFDKAAGETTDAIRELNGAGEKSLPLPGAAADPVLAREQARRVGYAADLAKLDLDERLGKLLPIADVEAAMVDCAEAMVRKIDQLPTLADQVASAVAREGALGARSFLRTIARDLRKSLETEMRLIAESTQEHDGTSV
jgi:DNA-binding MarR family transcriptional regulator